VRETATQNAAQGLPNLLIRSIWFFVESGLCRQDHATQAKPALGGSFLNKRLLDWVRLFKGAQALQSRNFILTNCTHRHHTRPHDLAAHDYCAGSALSHATSESRSAQSELVIQNKQQGRFWINRHEVLPTIHIQGDLLHPNGVAPLLLLPRETASVLRQSFENAP
jgi:hypothetical protein